MPVIISPTSVLGHLLWPRQCEPSHGLRAERTLKASSDEAAQHAKSRLDAGETFKKIHPPDWNAGAWPRIPH